MLNISFNSATKPSLYFIPVSLKLIVLEVLQNIEVWTKLA